MSKKEITYFHGDVIHKEYPEHLDWFLPELAKNLNKVLASERLSCEFNNINYRSESFELNINSESKKYSMTSFQSPDQLIESVVEFINKKNGNGNLIFVSRPFNASNLTISLSSGQEIKTLEDFKIPNKSNIYPADFYLPIFDNSSKPELTNLFKSIADLNTENSINFKINDIQSTEYIDIEFNKEGNSQTIRFDVRDFDRIGIELNKFQDMLNPKFVLLEPNDDDIQYAFCPNELISELARHQLVRKEYLKNKTKA